MDQWREEDNESRNLFRAHVVSLLGVLLPGGEVLLPYFFVRRLKNNQITDRISGFLAFQKSWWLYRSLALALTLAVTWHTQGSPNVPEEGSGQIIAEPEKATPLPRLEDRRHRLELRQYMRDHRSMIWEITMQQGEFADTFLRAAVGFTLYAVLWVFANFCTFVNILRIGRHGFPLYPLTLPLFKKKAG